MGRFAHVQVADYGALDGRLSRRGRSAVAATQKDTVRIMRKGTGSVDDQWRRQGSMSSQDRFVPWKKAQPFGNRPAPARTLKRTGQYLAAWRGEGAGSFARVQGGFPTAFIEIGVDSARFPQVQVFQRSTSTRIPVTPKMRVFLGKKYGVWLKKSTKAIEIPPRPFRVSASMVSRVSSRLIDYIVRGE